MSAWVDQVFSAAQAANGGVIRRSKVDVVAQGALDEIVGRAKANEWHVIETGGQIVILCHPGTVSIYC